MLRITSHLERLLLQHDCIIVPDFGGFVLQRVSASYDKEKQLFRPMHKEIVFNTTLQHNDGLLCESYMKQYDLNYEKAHLLLAEDIEAMRQRLHAEKTIELGSIGFFDLGSEQQLVFRANVSDLFSVDSYGFSSFHVDTLESLSATKRVHNPNGHVRESDLIYISIPRKWLRRAAVVAATLALLLLVSTPVTDQGHASYTASFIPLDVVAHPVATTACVGTAEEVGQLVHESDTAEQEAIAPAAETALVSPVKNQKNYYIVIASLLSDKQADDFIATVDCTTYSGVNKIECEGKIRVYIDKFVDRDRAEAYLETIRLTERHKDAWLFISRH